MNPQKNPWVYPWKGVQARVPGIQHYSKQRDRGPATKSISKQYYRLDSRTVKTQLGSDVGRVKCSDRD